MLRFQKLVLTLIIELFKFIILVLFCFNDEIDAFTSVKDEFILLKALLNDELSVNIESNVFDALITEVFRILIFTVLFPTLLIILVQMLETLVQQEFTYQYHVVKFCIFGKIVLFCVFSRR